MTQVVQVLTYEMLLLGGNKEPALDHIIEGIRLKKELRGAAWLSIVETEPSRYALRLRHATGRLVSLRFEGGFRVDGIVDSVAESRVTLAAVIDESVCLHYSVHDMCSCVETIPFHDAWLVEVCSGEAKRSHLARYRESPVANVGRLMTGFTRCDSYQGIVTAADSLTVVLSHLKINDDVYGPREFELDHFTDGLEWHEPGEARAHVRDFPIFAERDPDKFKHMTEAQLLAFEDFQAVAPGCRLHGSTVYGLSTADSDVDVCVEESRLYELANELSSFDSNIHVEEDLLDLKIPRLKLRHNNGTPIDAVNMQCYNKEKDVAMSRICEVPRYRSFLARVRSWWKALEFDPALGYPNTFNMLLVAVWFLQYSMDVPSWPGLVASRPPRLSCDRESTENDLFGSFLHFLSNRQDSCTIKMDLRAGSWYPKWNGGCTTWFLSDPCTDRHSVFSGLDAHMVDDIVYEAIQYIRGLPEFRIIHVEDTEI